MELTPFEQIVLDSIKEIQSFKSENGKAPDFATLTEVENSFKVDLKEALNSLCRKDCIEWHKTVNGIPMFGVKE